ncbi:histidine kinase [Streptomyces sp. NBC_01497]|nr:histidine kinase [Streptomyces sp. NBC_01497]
MVDAGITLVVQAAETIPFVVPRGAGLPPATWTAYGMTALTVAPLLWRRRAPVTVLLAVYAAQALYLLAPDGPGQVMPYNALTALYTVAVLSPARRRVGALVFSFVLVLPATALNTGQAKELLVSLFLVGAAYGLGRLTRVRQEYTRAVEDRAAQLERLARIEAEQAVAGERARIAREMHDVLSHAVSLMVVQAEAGPVALRTAPERALAAFDAISETGRDAMVQLRGMLGLLRAESGSGARPVPRSPRPGLADLPELVGRVAAGGLAVSYTTTGVARPVPPSVGATVHRVVQEALTNVVRHADAHTARVVLAYGTDTLEITVVDDGRGTGDGGAVSGGLGLLGVRERAAALGGSTYAGHGPGGQGFRVAVELPLPTPREGSLR